MTQAQLNSAVCRVTGEPREVVQRMGFSLLVPPTPKQVKRIERSAARILRMADYRRNRAAAKPA
jgi:hypothetical protein